MPLSKTMKKSISKIAVDKEWRHFSKALPAWNTSTVKSKQDIRQERARIASLMDLCHPRHAELAEQLQSFEGRVVLRGDNVLVDTGGHAVFTEQGGSASHMTAAEVLDMISRLPGVSGEANDAVSAYPEVNISDAPRLIELLEKEGPGGWIRLLRDWRSMVP